MVTGVFTHTLGHVQARFADIVNQQEAPVDFLITPETGVQITPNEREALTATQPGYIRPPVVTVEAFESRVHSFRFGVFDFCADTRT